MWGASSAEYVKSVLLLRKAVWDQIKPWKLRTVPAALQSRGTGQWERKRCRVRLSGKSWDLVRSGGADLGAGAHALACGTGLAVEGYQGDVPKWRRRNALNKGDVGSRSL